MESLINSISIEVLENEVLEYNHFKNKFLKYEKMSKNNFLKCCIYKKKLYYERKYKSKLFYLKLKYSYNNLYLQHFKGLEETDLLENIIKNKQTLDRIYKHPNIDQIPLAITKQPKAYAIPIAPPF